jgi:hypothetical protein
MARAVLTEVGDWFEHTIFEPLRRCADPQSGVAQMLDRVVDYFHSGRRACLVGVFALSSSRDRFPLEINSYFRVWQSDLATALARRGLDADTADALAEETIATLQGALVLARARDEPDIFLRAVARLRARLT